MVKLSTKSSPLTIPFLTADRGRGGRGARRGMAAPYNTRGGHGHFGGGGRDQVRFYI